MIKKKIFLLPVFIVCLTQMQASFAQKKTNEDLIAASQADAAPVFFDISAPAIPVISPGNFHDDLECIPRGGLPAFFTKAKTSKHLRVAYIGGSITYSNYMYRTQSAKYIQSLFPGVKVEGINAGISGTDADLGACRLYDQVLKHKPDLLFVEFAVNGGYPQGVEGIIRQTKKLLPQTSICLVYTTTSEQLKKYEQGIIPDTIRKLELIADHYNIPSIHMAKEAAALAKAGKLIEKADGTANDSIAFSKDGVHPLERGGNLYAAAIARSLLKMQQQPVTAPNPTLSDPLYPDNWDDAKMLAPQQSVNFSPEWERIDPATSGFATYKTWFPYLMKAEKPGSNMSFTFNGSMFGFFDIGGPEAGQLNMLVDGSTIKLKKDGTNRFVVVPGIGDHLNRFNSYCNNRHRGQFICIELPQGKHTVSLTISGNTPDKKLILGKKQLADITQNPEKYNRSVIYIGKILLRGNIIKK